MEWFLRSNSTGARICRTIVQGIIAVIISVLPDLIGLFDLDPTIQAALVAALMAILSPIMAEIGKHVENVNAAKRARAALEVQRAAAERAEG